MENHFEQALENLKHFWGYAGFRDQQDEAIRSILEREDTLVLFPTGGGKSLCYQVPATVFNGITLVISPLVALMQDQVHQLSEKGVPATFINSTLPRYEVEQRLINARNGMYKLLYCAPERLSTPFFQSELENLNVELVAIDEAHCISEWGHDFRPAYRKIRESLNSLPPSTRWLALTATATPEVKKDILTNLAFTNPKIISKGFKRPNLIWWVVRSENKRPKIIRSVQRAAQKGDGLMYGGTRKNCEHWASEFSGMGIRSEAYHAGFEGLERKAIQERWITGATPLVVATNAFGMGIDKPDCRYVIHEEIPFSIEAYYQEAGRAGRDGSESYPILFFKDSDFIKLRKRIQDHYPTWDELQKIYNTLSDDLGLAVGSQLSEPKNFKLDSLKKRSGIPIPIIKSGLRLLEQFGVVAMQSDVPERTQIQFTLSLEMISVFKERTENPEKGEFLDKLIRIFGHRAFSNMVEIETEFLFEKLKITRNSLIKALNVLMQHDGVLIYSMYESSDLIRPLHPRVHTLPVSKTEIEAYRSNLLSKLDYMHGYVNTRLCREVYLLNYFGEVDAHACGKCDNCNKQSKAAFIPNADDNRSLFHLLIDKKKSLHECRAELGWSVDQAQSVVQYLITEGMIVPIDEKPGFYKVTD